MRCSRLAVVLGTILVAGCDAGVPTVTSIVFDGEPHPITGEVVCTTQPTRAGLVILAQGKSGQLVRIHLTQVGRIVVQKVGLRYDDHVTGFVADPQEITGIKVDDAYTVSGRMPPNPGESQWHTFKIQTTCPGYRDALPHDTVPEIGSP
ncbi:lipoprotein LpqH [Mycolicibacterium aubagnense]|uniref:lipoprotein LpqH n=1 Tax=Mycolicibacterium aubagnense TaxID=319707 RepID=UPI0010FD1886|nr:lipoprotein LpqH [Mycolicibacterium aubagnense]WGI30831.1 lipoprotein LpqH [Mycolicibacterium aubagnense]